MNHKRIKYFDGLRGLCILSVVLYHAYSRWGNIETFNQSKFLSDFFSYGFYAVEIFFAISGYFIYQSLLRTKRFSNFGLKRYLRLAPAMYLGSLFIFITSFWIIERPLGLLYGTPSIVDLLPSLTFVQEGLLSRILGFEILSLDGSFWSIYVEVRFYFIVAFLYYFLKDKKLNLLFILFIPWIFISIFDYNFDNNYQIITFLKPIFRSLVVKHYGWFLMGIFASKYKLKPNLKNLKYLFFVIFLAILSTGFKDLGNLLASTISAFLFISPIFIRFLRSILSLKIFLFFGYISYPLYIIHQNFVTGLAIKIHSSYVNLFGFIYPLLPILIAILFSYLITKLEPYIKIFLEDKIKRIYTNLSSISI
tara:strand:+ start:260 stop:1351 length:1092 start_codon:yes stop_codon:yes gene_type:complete